MDTYKFKQYAKLYSLAGHDNALALLDLKLRYYPQALVEIAEFLLPEGYKVVRIEKAPE